MKPIKVYILNKTAICLAAIVFFQAIFPQAAFALTSGPSTPEVQSFEPVGTSEMVDLFSGDFNYNIPLLEVGGYPINIAYHAGIRMEDEASWVGLGWNLNPGVINRNMRGIPDDFSGEIIEKNVHIKDNHSASITLTPSVDLIGKEVGGINLTAGLKYDNYRGFNVIAKAGLGLDIVKMGSSSLNLNIGVDLQEGISITPNLSFSNYIKGQESKGWGLNIGAPYNSREGLKALSFSVSKGFDARRNLEKSSALVQKIGRIGSSFTFNTPSYITHAEHDVNNYSVSLELKIGGEIPFTNLQGAATGTYNLMSVNGKKKMKAFGYLNSEKANHSTDLMDFNREKEGPYYKSSSQLPLTNVTYDTYSILGQGVGGVFRPYRNQIGYVSDPIARGSDRAGADLGIEAGIPTSPVSFKAGGSGAFNIMKSYSGIWKDENTALPNFGFDKTPDIQLERALYEKSYFKQIGELSVDSRYVDLKNDDALRPDVFENEVSSNFYGKEGDEVLSSDINTVRGKRAIRNQPMTRLSVAESNLSAVIRTVESYTPGVSIVNEKLNKTTETIQERTEALDIKKSQDYELTTTKSDGMRYVYGLPAYNISQTEVSFNSSGNNVYYKDIDEGNNHEVASTVEFNKATDITNNNNGINGFSSVEKLPAYAYAYMLTSVLSPDYVDFTGDGPTDDDFGTWVKFNYTKITNGTENYFWKFPYVKDQRASLNEGFKSYSKDDKGNYIEGEKELWQLHSVESKNHIAIFHTADRRDGFGINASDESTNDTGADISEFTRQKKLDKIEHYSKHDLLSHGDDAIPLKTVHLKYNYSLCPGIPNSMGAETTEEPGSGKLTLESLYFTYGKSTKGERSKYKFHYPTDATGNPAYNRKSQDRWGNYKPEFETEELSFYDPKQIATSEALNNSDYPYAEQDRTKADENARAWNMNKIELPSGGIIDIEYEADDYAYIQDKRAGQMFQIDGLFHDIPEDGETGSGSLISVTGNPAIPIFNHKHNNIIAVDVDDNLIQSDQDFRDLYLNGIDKLYFRSLVKLKGEASEFVPGYADILSSGVFTTNGNKFGYIELRGVGIDDTNDNGDLNPITKAALNFTRLNLPHLVWPEKDPENNDFKKFLLSLVGLLTKEPSRILNGLNKSLLNEGYSNDIVLDKSFVRLNNPGYDKIGGGCRVKRITMNDNWSQMAGDVDSEYGHEYFYTKVEETDDGVKKVISSGVATYEPILGNDENPYRVPLGESINESNLLAPDNNFYVEGPIGESFFPSASVGYSEVTVAATRPDKNIIRTATGFTRSKFYTAKDFPIKTIQNLGSPYIDEGKPINKILKYKADAKSSASAGYSIILNDMHGKPKSVSTFNGALNIDDNMSLVYGADDMNRSDYISSQVFHYKTNFAGDQLVNEVKTIDPMGHITEQIVGVESEMTLDYRENKTEVSRAKISVDLDTWIIPFIIPPVIPIPSVWPSFQSSSTQFRSAVATKLVTKHGLLDRIDVHSNGSIISTKNELYDAVTGEVLITSVNNEYKKVKDPNVIETEIDDSNNIYNTTYPAHWAYTGMQQAAKNLGAEFLIGKINDDEGQTKLKIVSDISGNAFDETLDETKVFHVGDEVIGHQFSFEEFSIGPFSWFIVVYKPVDRLWVSKVDTDADGEYFTLIDKDGELFEPSLGDFEGELDPQWEYLQYPKIKIARSGHRNQQSLPIASMTSLKNPIPLLFSSTDENNEIVPPTIDGDTPIGDQAEALQVLDVSAQEFSDDWDTYCRDGSYQGLKICEYELQFFHPESGVEDVVKTEINSNGFVNVEYDKQVNSTCLDEPLYQSNEIIEYSPKIRTRVDPSTEFFNQSTPLYLEYVKLYRSDTEEHFLVPLAPDDVNSSFPAKLNCSNSNCVSVLNENLYWYPENLSSKTEFRNALTQVISNYLIDQVAGVDINNFNIEVTSWLFNSENGISVTAYCKDNPTDVWVGNNLNDNEVRFYDPGISAYVNTSFNTVAFDFYESFAAIGEESLCKNLRRAFYENSPIDWSETNYNSISLNSSNQLRESYEGIGNTYCTQIGPIACFDNSALSNPYVQGTKGNFRPSKSYVHNNVPRVQAAVDLLSTEHSDIADKGYYQFFDQFWNKPAADELWSKDESNYTKATEITRYNPYGEALESVDALGNYSSAILGYDNKLAIAVGQNTKYNNFGYDGFEEHDFFENEDQCSANLHMQMGVDSPNGQLNSLNSHTGKYSLECTGTVSMSMSVSECEDSQIPPSQGINEDGSYMLSECEDCLPRFSPKYNEFGNNKYVVDLWVKGGGSFSIFQSSEGPEEIFPVLLFPNEEVIEGWQRIYGVWELASIAETVSFSFNPDGTSYIDDLRIYPFDAVMKSFVYDPGSLKLTAELDENNHATFYEYDEEWNLIRVKKETEKGIYTIQENRSNVRMIDQE